MGSGLFGSVFLTLAIAGIVTFSSSDENSRSTVSPLARLSSKLQALTPGYRAGEGNGTNSVVGFCGDTIHSFNEEDCDDGNQRNGDGCDSNCKVEEGWSCHTGARLRSICIFEALCGNDILDAQEECDDGNQDASDACTNKCQVNHAYFLKYTFITCSLAALCMLLWAGVVFLWGELFASLPIKTDLGQVLPAEKANQPRS